MNCFVYGSLLKGMYNSKFLNRSPCLGIAFTQGILYDLGDYPGMKKGNGLVYGEVYDINSQVLAKLDQLETFLPGKENYSFYLRKEIAVTMMKDGQTLKAWTYFYNQDISNTKRIHSGDYRRFRAEKKLHQWCIAYGSNMSSKRLIDRVGFPIDSVPGYLEAFRLVFNKDGMGNGVYANIQSAGPKDRCPFVAYCLSMHQVKRLDEYEGEPDQYVRIGLPFYNAKVRNTILGHIYVARPNKLVRGKRPSAGYLEHIRTGYKENGFETSLFIA